MNASVMAFAMFLGNLSTPTPPAEQIEIVQQPRNYQIAYSNTLVDFSMQNQEIVQDSICRNHAELGPRQQHDCKTHARLMFSETCNQLSTQTEGNTSRYKKTFCETAYTLHPGSTGIGLVSNKDEDPAFIARQQCSEFTLRAQSTGAGAHIALRDESCKKARRLTKRLPTHPTLAQHL